MSARKRGNEVSISPSRLALWVCTVFAVAGGVPAGAAAAFPGTPGKVAFGVESPGFAGIDSIETNSTGRVNLASFGGADISGPEWSADGERLTFALQDASLSSTLFVMNADGSGLTPIFSGDLHNPSFFPDGRAIAFELLDGGDYDIFRINVDGSGLVNLTSNGVDDFEPAVSPDGTQIAYSGDYGGDDDIAVMPAGGGASVNITPFAVTNEQGPNWSPDGRRIVFSSNLGGGDYDLYTINSDGTGLSGALTNGGSSEFGPAFAPDGNRIYYTQEIGPDNNVSSIPASGGAATVLTNNAFGPSIQPLNAPTCSLTDDSRPTQKSTSRILVDVFCSNENARAIASGTITYKKPQKKSAGATSSRKKTATFRSVSVPVAPSTQAAIALKIPKAAKRALKKTGKAAKAAITIQFLDESGASATATANVKVKPKKKKK